MFGLTIDKLIVIVIIAAIIIGPERLPLYAKKLASLVKAVRGFLDTAKSRAVDELGPDFDPAEWKKLDPRQYDPRRIVQDALAEGGPAEPVPSAVPAATSWQTALLARVGTAQKPTDSPSRASE